MLRALIVEDEMLVRIGVKSAIDWPAAGIGTVFEASNGLDAYEIYQKEKPDIIITDLKMPDMDGIALIRAIRVDNHDTVTRIIVLSCMDEFPLVQQALNLGVSHYFLKVTMKCDELQAVLNALTGEMIQGTHGRSDREGSAEFVQEYIRACVNGSPERSDTSTVLHEIGFDEKENFTCARIRLIGGGANQTSGVPNTKFLLQVLRRRISGAVKIEVAYLDWNDYAVLLQVETPEALQAIFDGWCTDLKLYANINVHIGFSSVSSRGDLPKALALAERALMQCFFTSDGACYTSTANDAYWLPDLVSRDLSALPNKYIHIPASFLEEYTRKVRLLTEKQYPTPEAFKEALGGLMVWLSTQVDRVCAPIEQINVDYTRQLLACNTLAESLAVFGRFAAAVMGTSSFSKNMPPVIITVLSYIYDNLEKPMSLQAIARHAHLNASYLSTLFKKVMNRSLIDYINACKIKRAEILLQETNSSVTQIAQSVGYSEDIYFYRLFKRFSGLTPGEYRCRQQKAR
ncbi:MAG TPA: hypothetical protein DD640_09840 [Clostridiales bacterium]|nr:hypothetical protein [Clostridiales bacterium]